MTVHINSIANARGRMMAKMKNKMFLPAREVSRRIKVDNRTFLNMINRGEVPGAYIVGHVWLIPSDWVYNKKRKKRLVKKKKKKLVKPHEMKIHHEAHGWPIHKQNRKQKKRKPIDEDRVSK